MRFLIPKIDDKISVVVVHDCSQPDTGVIGVLNDMHLMVKFLDFVGENRGPLRDLPPKLGSFHRAYLERVRSRVYSANGDFCPPLVDSVVLQMPTSSEGEFARFQHQTLSPREMQLCELLWEGKTNADIAELWHRSELTVKKHKENLYQKFGRRLNPSDISAILFTAASAGLEYAK